MDAVKLGPEAAQLWECAVDAIRDPLLQAREDRLLLRLRQPSGGYRRIELLLLGGVEDVHEITDGLAVLPGNLRESFAALELRPELCLGQPEIGRGCGEIVADMLERPVAEATEAEQRHRSGFDARFQRVAFGFREPSCCDGGVDAILERLLQRIRERARLHAELLSRVIHDGGAFLTRRAELRCADRDPAAGNGEGGRRSRDELRPSVHSRASFAAKRITAAAPKSAVRGA